MPPTPRSRLESLFGRVLDWRWWIVAAYSLLIPGALVLALRIPRDNALERMVVAGDPEVSGHAGVPAGLPGASHRDPRARDAGAALRRRRSKAPGPAAGPRPGAEGGHLLRAHRLGAPAPRRGRPEERPGGAATLRRRNRVLPRARVWPATTSWASSCHLDVGGLRASATRPSRRIDRAIARTLAARPGERVDHRRAPRRRAVGRLLARARDRGRHGPLLPALRRLRGAAHPRALPLVAGPRRHPGLPRRSRCCSAWPSPASSASRSPSSPPWCR